VIALDFWGQVGGIIGYENAIVPSPESPLVIESGNVMVKIYPARTASTARTSNSWG
jgi:hypothetical protein